MTTEQLWYLYDSVKNSTEDTEKKEAVFLACIKQEDDIELKAEALCSYGLMLCDRGTPKDIEAGENLLKLSAELEYDCGMIFYGRMLVDKGKLDGVQFIAGAMLKGMILAGGELKEYYDFFKKSSNKAGVEKIETAVKLVKDIALKDVVNGRSGNGELCLAALGLYGLVDESDIDRKKATEYIKDAAKKGNELAEEIVKDSQIIDFDLEFEEEVELEDFDEEAFDREVDELLKAEEQTQKKNDGKILKKSLVIGVIGGLIVSNVLHINLVLSFIVVSIVAAIVLKKKM